MERKQTLREEKANSITHGIGAFLSLVGLCVILTLSITQKDPYRIISSSIYGISLVLLYLSSSLYHGSKKETTKKILRIFDHSSIYLLIAGTYTPFCLVTLRSIGGLAVFCTLWTLTAIGITLKIFFTGRFNGVSTLMYLLMGWIVMLVMKQFVIAITLTGFLWVLAGGLFYSLGVIFYALEKKPFFHTIWHFFVMGGSACHFLAILFYVL